MTKVPGVLLIKCKDRIVRVLKTLNKNQVVCTQGVHATMHKVKKYSNEIFVRATNWETEKKKSTFTSSGHDYSPRIPFEVHQNL